MRFIGSLSDHKHAERFVAYLITQGIQSHIEPEDEQFEIWIKDEDSLPSAVTALDEFRDSPDEPKYVEAPTQAREIQNQLIRKRKRIAKNVVSVSDRMGRRNHSLTITLMVICGVVALLTNFGENGRWDRVPFRSLAFVSEPKSEVNEFTSINDPQLRLKSVLDGEIWRLVTPIFIHHGVFHLIFNMYWLFVLGAQIENRFGTLWYAALVLGSAAISNLIQCLVPDSVGGSVPVPVGQYVVNLLGGMSGVNYALFGFIWMRILYDPRCGLQLGQFTVVILLGWLVFCMTPLAVEFTGGRPANWAHAIGMLVGVMAGYWPTVMPAGRNKTS